MKLARRSNREQTTRRRIIRAVDLFCGAGGFDSGFVRLLEALGIAWALAAVNHWHRALETHQLNHPGARQYLKDLHALTEFDIQNIVWGKPGKGGRRRRFWLDLLTASPTCTQHSQARGGLPINDQQRMDPWAVINWITALHGRVRCVLVENVTPFVDWGPLDEHGRPLKGLKGMHFRAWVAALEALGYVVEWRIICAADLGDPTTRERFFLQARKDGKPIRWPEATHQKPGTEHVLSLFGDHNRPLWRSAADHVIDWTNLGRSIIDRPRSLLPNTVNRVGTGAVRFGGSYAPVLDVVMGEVRYRAKVEEFWMKSHPLTVLADPEQNPLTGYSARELLTLARAGKLKVIGRRPRATDKAKDVRTRRIHLPAPADPELRAAWQAARHAYAEVNVRDAQRVLAFRSRGEALVRIDPEAETYAAPGSAPGGGRPVHAPVPGFTAQGGHMALSTPFVFPANQGHGRTRGLRPVSLPVDTVLTGDTFAFASPVAFTCANRMNNAPRPTSWPVSAATTATGGGIILGTPVVLGQHGGAAARPWSFPVPTIATAGKVSVSFPVAQAVTLFVPGLPFAPSMPPGSTASAYLMAVNHRDHRSDAPRLYDTRSPIPTVAGHRGLALAAPSFWLQPYYSGYNLRADAGTVPVTLPVPAVTTHGRFGLASWDLSEASAGIIRFFDAQQGQAPRFHSVPPAPGGGAGRRGPMVPWMISTRQLSPGYGPAPRPVWLPPPTVTSGGSQVALATPLLDGWSPYLVGIDHASGGDAVQPVTLPVRTIVTKQSVAVVSPALYLPDAALDLFGLRQATPSFTEPLAPAERPTGRRVYVDGVAIYVDIRFRMLTNRELARAMSFEDGEYEYHFTGTEEEQCRQIGNAVPVRTARALCGAMLWDVIEAHGHPSETGGQFQAAA